MTANTATTLEHDQKPWYQQFWPWFLLTLPLSVVIASLYMVKIAITGADQLITKDYYKNGLTINQVKSDLEKAKSLNLSSIITTQGDIIQINLETPSSEFTAPQYISVHLQHPLEESADQQLILAKQSENLYIGTLPKVDSTNTNNKASNNGFWYIDIQSANQTGKPDNQWRIKGKILNRDQRSVLK